jgi:hypothetical protein
MVELSQCQKIHKDTIIKEVERLCKLGVLERQPASEWASTSFIIPKKDRTICFLSDFWELNKRLEEGFTFATALDLNMCY